MYHPAPYAQEEPIVIKQHSRPTKSPTNRQAIAVAPYYTTLPLPPRRGGRWSPRYTTVNCLNALHHFSSTAVRSYTTSLTISRYHLRWVIEFFLPLRGRTLLRRCFARILVALVAP